MFAIKSIREIVQLFGPDKVVEIEKAVKVLIQALSDYSVDRRGDIGSWVRQEAMICFKDILLLDKEMKVMKVKCFNI
jgi:hypothetical protein